MIQYPLLTEGTTIGITAPSSGVPQKLHEMFKLSYSRMEEKGFQIICGETVWTQKKAKSAPAKKRADEFHQVIHDDPIHAIMPPWGGKLLIEILEHIDFENIKNKWIMGYSDTSLLLLAITLNTGIATAHGPNFVDLRGEYQDDTTAMWKDVLSTGKGNSILQRSSVSAGALQIKPSKTTPWKMYIKNFPMNYCGHVPPQITFINGAYA